MTKETLHQEPEQQDDSLTSDLQDIQDAKEAQVDHKDITNPQEAENYLNYVREFYRNRAKGAEYRGTHTPEDLEEREFIELEGQEIMEGLRMLVEKLAGQEPKPAEDRELYKLGQLEFEDMVQSFLQLYAGMATLTHRLERDNPQFQQSGYQRIAALSDKERAIVAAQLFKDFQDFNALRFGAESAGVTRKVRKQDAEGEIVEISKDADLASNDAQIAQIASHETYRENIAMHPAGKLSPDQARALRQQNRHLDRDEFYTQLWSARDAFKKLSEQLSEGPLPGR